MLVGPKIHQGAEDAGVDNANGFSKGKIYKKVLI